MVHAVIVNSIVNPKVEIRGERKYYERLIDEVISQLGGGGTPCAGSMRGAGDDVTQALAAMESRLRAQIQQQQPAAKR